MPIPYIHGNSHALMGSDPMLWPKGDPAQGISIVEYFLNSSDVTPWSLQASGSGVSKQYPDVPTTPEDKANGVWTIDTSTTINSNVSCTLGQLGAQNSQTTLNGIMPGLGNLVMKFRLKLFGQYYAAPGPDFYCGLLKTSSTLPSGSVGGLFFGFGSNQHINPNGSAWYVGYGAPAGGVTYIDTSVGVEPPSDGFIWLELDVSADGKTVTWKVNGVAIEQITNNAFLTCLAPAVICQLNASAPAGSFQKVQLDTFGLSYAFLN